MSTTKLSQTVSNDELTQFDNGYAKCLSCGSWYDVSDQGPLTEFSCAKCGSLVLTPFRISKYWLYDLIGEGGMGFVYQAQQPGDLNLYAIKIAQIENEDDFRFQSLLYEGEIYIEMDHPNIPKAHNFGFKHGVAFLIMDYEFGCTLDEHLLEEGNFPVSETQVLKWMIQIVEALKYMFEKGYIYRDMKPQNVLIDGEHSILTDLGLCMHVEHYKDIDEENLVGSPSYLPPERIDLEPEDLRSDMYSLGMVFFYATSGFNYFEGDSHEVVVEMHTSPERKPVIEANPKMSAGFAQILNKLIQFKMEDRYQDYDSLLQDLRNLENAQVTV